MANISNIKKQTTKKASGRAFTEIGKSGVRRVGGYVQADFLPQLNGPRGVKVYREMRDNDATIGGCTSGIEQTVRQPDWFVRPGGDSQLARKAADFVKECMGDMYHTWDQVLSETLSSFTYGWVVQEFVFKLRDGDSRDPKRNSKFSDGKIGWRKISRRLQTSLFKWEYDEEEEEPIAMVQMPAPSYREIPVPLSKAFLFRTRIEGNSPEGRSILRNAYRSWFIKKSIEEIEATGIEKDLIGLPVLIAPENFDFENASEDLKDGISQLLYSLRRDEQDGVSLPGGWELTLLGAGQSTRRQFDVDKVINRYDKRIAISLLSQAILIGMDRVGSFALSQNQVDDFFLVSAQCFLNSIAEEHNKISIPMLLRMNPEFLPLFKSSELPILVPGRISKPGLTEITNFVSQLSDRGFIVRDEDIMRDLRIIGQLSEPKERSITVLSGGRQKSLPLDRSESKSETDPGRAIIPTPKDEGKVRADLQKSFHENGSIADNFQELINLVKAQNHKLDNLDLQKNVLDILADEGIL